MYTDSRLSTLLYPVLQERTVLHILGLVVLGVLLFQYKGIQSLLVLVIVAAIAYQLWFYQAVSDAKQNGQRDGFLASIPSLSPAEFTPSVHSPPGHPPVPLGDKVLVNPATLESLLRSDFAPTTYKNPFGNVLLTDIQDNPEKKPAAPSFHPEVGEDIRLAVQKQTQKLYPDIANTDKQLYGDLKAQYDLDNAMMRFYSMPNTRVGNDQGAFGQFLFGGMYSAKEDTPEGAMMRVKDNERYILI